MRKWCPPRTAAETYRNIWPRHREGLRLIAQGYRVGEAASAVGLSTSGLSNLANSPLGRARMNKLQGQRDQNAINVRAQLDALAPKAMKVLEDIVENGSSNGRNISVAGQARAAQDILDRTGYGAVKKIETNREGGMTIEQWHEWRENALAAGRQYGIIKDVDSSIEAPRIEPPESKASHAEPRDG